MQQLPKNTLLQGGKYRIEKVLGQGGFGITYLATQELLDRKVCIKEFYFKDSCSRNARGEVTIGAIGNRDLVERFLNKFIKEARTLSQLDHSNIIRVLDIFKENNTAYYVMDFIEGSSLEDIVNSKGILSESHAIDYIKQVANALDYIHQRSINHLDVKPANIMVRKSDNKAILIDFGVSKQYDSTGEQTSTTPVGISYGYAPIEQYRPGGVSEFSPQADIYALGATLYKLVIGKIPPQAIEIFNEGLLRLPQSLSSNISNAVQNAMQLKKNDRPKSVSEFLSILNVSRTNQKASSIAASKQPVSETKALMKSTIHFSKEKFVKIIVDVLGVNPKEVVENASFINDLGADSLDLVEIVMHVEQEFGIFIDDDFLDINQNEIITVGDAISFLDQAILMKIDHPLSVKDFNNILNASKKKQNASSFITPEPKPSANETTVLIKSIQPKNEINGHEYVDLGLSVKWATCNIGANKPEEYGCYFAWGEVSPKNSYTELNYKHVKLGKKIFNVFKSEILLDNSIDFDMFDNIGQNISISKYDAAKINWESSWRLPTEKECEELVKRCQWIWTSLNGKAGYKIIGPNGNSLFLPAGGWRISTLHRDVGSYGEYWTSTQGNGTTYAYCIHFKNGQYLVNLLNRHHGYNIRPVAD